MKKSIKLNQTQLRSLIKESIRSRSPGSPLWEAPGEVVGLDSEGPRNPSVQKAIESLAMTLSEDLAGMDFEPDEFLPEVTNELNKAVERIWADFGGR